MAKKTMDSMKDTIQRTRKGLRGSSISTITVQNIKSVTETNTLEYRNSQQGEYLYVEKKTPESKIPYRY